MKVNGNSMNFLKRKEITTLLIKWGEYSPLILLIGNEINYFSLVNEFDALTPISRVVDYVGCMEGPHSSIVKAHLHILPLETLFLATNQWNSFVNLWY